MRNQELKEKIVAKVQKMVGCDITYRPDDVDPILDAGWKGIPVGAMVWKDRPSSPTQYYIKINDNQAKDQAGAIIDLSDKQKHNMLVTYAIFSIIGPRQSK